MYLMRLSYLDKNILLRLAVLFIADFELIWYILAGWSYYVSTYYPLVQIGLMLVLTVCAGLTVRELRKFVRGFEGEDDIRMVLSQLPSEYHRFYDLDLTNRGNIDAAVVGPSGVWTIEVKSHSGRLTFENNQLYLNGHLPEKNFLSQAYAESAALREYVSSRLGQQILVHPVLVFSSRKAHMKFGLHSLKGVYVIGGTWLTKLIRGQEELLSQDQVAKIVSVLERQ
jgi:hypothetical protein